MSYHNVVHVGHQSHDPPSGYPSEYPPPPDFLPPQQPGFPNPHEFHGPPPPQPPHQHHQRYQDYFYEGYPPPHSAQPYNRQHYQNNPYDYDSGCPPFLNSCLAALCCCCLLERCCLW
ncbi:cysteine-rich and transmembrane domain-containing protein WIH2 [Rosa chinensis]|uniref:cysteine-rich and transmembrane domain-containing protein WIH2 n=1 Tax=Rosa chinensis TaxID=74649 RepID=UPI000D096F4B|nr:cysteine-rich and transmembrane domain-containing protein WIH2 [Rosa chinensis]